MSVLLEQMLEFKKISTRIPASVFFFLTETDKAIAKFTWENIRAQLTIFLKKKV